MRVGELVDETRLAHAGLADDRCHLPVTGAGELLGATELLQFGVAANEPRQATAGGRLQTGARRTGPGDLIDFDGLAQPLDVDGAERLDLDEPLGESERVGR
jgi:hypothetical protein